MIASTQSLNPPAQAPRGDAIVTVLPPIHASDEMHHRIANSLQLLSAMVSVDARMVQDPAARATLERAQQRIGAIGRVHRQLYREQHAATIDLHAYLGELAEDLEASFSHGDAHRRVRVDAMPVEIAPDRASLIGMLVCELVSNACKYAYAAGVPGDLRVTLRALAWGGYVLEVEDRGAGGGAMDGQARGTGFGSQLVAMLSRRLGGAHRWEDARPGTRFVLQVGAA